MKEAALLLNDMVVHGVIDNYAIFGAVTQMRQTEAVAATDVDVLVAVPESEVRDVPEPIYSFCRTRGWHAEGEAIRVGNWPVQFIPAFDSVTKQAMSLADTGEIAGVRLRVVRADYLAAMAYMREEQRIFHGYSHYLRAMRCRRMI